MAFGKNNEQFMIEEGIVEKGVWTQPQLIGTDTTDPFSRFSGNDIGYFKQGSMKVMINRTYAEFMAGTPGKLARKDMITKKFSIELQAAQTNSDLLALLTGALTQVSYAVTTPSAKTLDLAWIGPDEPTQAQSGYLISTRLVNGKEFYVAMWSGKSTAEDVSPTFSGTEHVLINAKFEAFPDANFTGALADQKSYGLMWIDQT